jgi:hypothetical protein
MKIPVTAHESYQRVKRSDLKPFQGNLKELAKEEYDYLKKSLQDEGFFDPVTTWTDSEDTIWIIDGHQRLFVMDSEGWDIDSIPIAPMPAKDREEAARRLLKKNARYGKVTGAGLNEFMTEFNISVADLVEFTPPEIDYTAYKMEFYDIEGELPNLPDGDKSPFQQMVFILHDSQVGHIKDALSLAKELSDFDQGVNENSNGNALFTICADYMTRNGIR